MNKFFTVFGKIETNKIITEDETFNLCPIYKDTSENKYFLICKSIGCYKIIKIFTC